MIKSYSQLRILVVEDTASSRTVAIYYLNKLGCQTAIAENGLKALELCKQEIFDLVFMDLEMPLMNGMEALIRIKTEETLNRQTPIIALTANEQEEKKSSCQKIGFCQILIKPFRFKDLEEAIKRWVA